MTTGPKPNFYEYDVIRALYIIDTKGPIGRHLLRKELDITECSARTILKKLMKSEYIDSTSAGQVITLEGRDHMLSKHFFDRAMFMDVGELSLGDYDYVIITRENAKDIKNGIDQRDAAIKIGGDGATVLIFQDGKFHMPPGFMDLEEYYPGDVANLKRILVPESGDILVIGSGKTKRLAQLSAMAAFETLF